MEYIAHADNATKASSQKVFNATKLGDYMCKEKNWDNKKDFTQMNDKDCIYALNEEVARLRQKDRDKARMFNHAVTMIKIGTILQNKINKIKFGMVIA